jgi:hypothetical protein
MEVLNLAIEIDGPAFRPMLRSLGYDPDAVKFGNHPPAAVDRYALASTVGSAGDLSQHSETEPRVAESGQVTSLKPPGWVGRGLYPAPSGVSGAMNDANRLVEMPPIVPANLTRADVLEFLHSRGWVSAYPEVHYLDAQELRQPVTNEIHQWAAALEIEFDNDLVDHNDPPFDSAVAPTTVAPAVSGNRGARRKKNPSAARKARAKRKG